MKFQKFFNYADPTAPAFGDDLVFLPRWDDEQWKKLLPYTESRTFGPGDILMRLGEVERAFYVLLEGRVEVLVPNQAGETFHPIGVRATGAVIGEQAFIEESTRSATIRALTAGSAMRLSWRSYELLRVREPLLAHDILYDLARVISVKLRQATAAMAR